MRSVWLVAVTALVGSLLGVTGVVAQGVAPVGSPLAAPAASAAPVAGGLGYTALSSPCRAVDTRSAGGVLAPGASRAFRMRGSVSFAAQGGSTSGCGVPSGATAVEVSVSSVTPSGASGFLRAFAAGSSVSATFLSYTAGRGITNTGTVPLNTAVTNDLGLSNAGGSTHVVIDIQGYFAPSGGASYVPLPSPCRVVDTRNAGGVLPPSGSRAFQVAGSGSVFAGQGGTAGGCGVPDGVPGVEVTVSVVTPTGANGFLRVAPNDGSVPTATFLNYTAGTGITNTGSITLADAEARDVSVRNFSGSTHVVIDVQGYYTTTAGQGSRYQTVTPCRAVDTRNAGGALTAGRTRAFQIAGQRLGYARQGAQSVSGCGVPQRALAVEASVTAVNPTAAGFTRPSPAGTVATGTFLNYTSVGAITNTGTLPLAFAGTNDLGITNFGASAAYVIDVYGYYEPSPRFPRSAETVSAGGGGGCVVLGGGVEARCWGENGQSQIGNGATVDQLAPAKVTGLSNVVQVANGQTHTCALLTDGTVRCWGENTFGQIGDGTTTSRPTPVAVSGLTDVVQVSVGQFHTCAVLANGAVRCWGRNASGQLGDGTTGTKVTPFFVSGLSGAVQVSAGPNHTCAVLANGSARCWGSNDGGQLGDGSTAQRLSPVAVSSLTGATQISAGALHTCALLGNGTVRCWGNNDGGQLGDGTTTAKLTPVAVSGLTEASQVGTGSFHTCALRADSTVRCWGDNSSGQLGDASFSQRSLPTPVSNLSGSLAVTQLEVGAFHVCAVAAVGLPVCWGNNQFGELGDGTGVTSNMPVAVTGFIGAVQIAAGQFHTCALRSSGTPLCWGSNTTGQLGDGTFQQRSVPATVSGVTSAVQLATGAAHTCALLGSGTVQCWGLNESGQLGDGTTSTRATPDVVAGLTNVVQIAAGQSHTCALRSDGTVRCWGDNSFGQIGDGTFDPRPSPVAVSGLSDAIGITAGNNHTCAVLSSGAARCWGDNEFGQVGDSSFSLRTTPVAVSGLTGTGGAPRVVSMAGGGSHTCALLSTGSVRCWGRNNAGQVGDNGTTDRSTPTAVGTIDAVVALASGDNSTCAARSNGSGRCWGNNNVGQLGDGTTIQRLSPTTVLNLSAAVQPAVGDGGHSCAVLGNGGARCWGNNNVGQLGDGTTSDWLIPIPVLDLP